jgi:hypothetical protein
MRAAAKRNKYIDWKDSNARDVEFTEFGWCGGDRKQQREEFQGLTRNAEEC